jgi:hypothetical protein
VNNIETSVPDQNDSTGLQQATRSRRQGVDGGADRPGKAASAFAAGGVKTRKLDQNALMWAGALNDIEQQLYVRKRMHSDEVWHIYFKECYLPEQHIDGVTKEG